MSRGPVPSGTASPVVQPAVARGAGLGRVSVPLRMLLFLMVAVVLGRLHDLSHVTSHLPIGKVLLPLGFAALLTDRRVMQRLRVLRTTQAKMFGLLMVAMILSLPFSLWPGGSIMEFRGFLLGTVPFVFLIAVGCTDERDLYAVARAIVVTGVCLGLAFLAGMGRGEEGRISLGETYDANDIALVGVIVFPFAVWLMRDRSRLWRWIGAAGGAGALATIMMSASRGGMLGLAAIVLLIAVRYGGRIPLMWKVVSVLLLVAALRFAPSTFWERLATLKDPDADYNTFAETGRLAIWKRGLGYFASRPMTGVGLGQFGAAEGAWSLHTYGPDVGFKWSATHSIWIQVLAEIGILGIIGFVGIYLPTVRQIWAARRRRRSRGPPPELQAFGEALGIALVGFFVSGTFLAMAYSPPAMLLAGMCMSYAYLARRAPAPVAPGGASRPSRRPWVSLGQRPRI